MSLPNIFEPFFRIDINNTSEHSLGLSFVRQVVILRYNMTLASRQGNGSTFTITLPQRNEL